MFRMWTWSCRVCSTKSDFALSFSILPDAFLQKKQVQMLLKKQKYCQSEGFYFDSRHIPYVARVGAFNNEWDVFSMSQLVFPIGTAAIQNQNRLFEVVRNLDS